MDMSAVSTERRSLPIIVQKYGGSSVADVDRIGRVADRVVETYRSGKSVVVVVSAMGKTTDGLLALARQVAMSGPEANFEAPRRELDMLVSTGERVSMAVLSIAIQARGVDAISFTGSQSGILTNDRHFDARIIEVRPHRIEDELSKGKVVIVAGYQGMSYRREITTLGRGGTDTTAVALTAALRAEACEIYSDVDGVYSADPRIVPEAHHVAELSTELVQELAESGAKVLCAQALEWARLHGVTIHARSTFAPREQARETIVVGQERDEAECIVCSERALVLVEGQTSSMRELTAWLGQLDIPAKERTGIGKHASLVIPTLNVPDFSTLESQMLRRFPQLSITRGWESVSVIGRRLMTAAALSAFEEAVAPFDPIRVTSGPLRLTALVRQEQAPELQRAIHRAMIVGAAGSPSTVARVEHSDAPR